MTLKEMPDQPSNVPPPPQFVSPFQVSSSPNHERIAPTRIRRQNRRMCHVKLVRSVHRQPGKRTLCDILEEVLSITNEIIDFRAQPTSCAASDDKLNGSPRDVITNTSDNNAEDTSITTKSDTN